MKTFPSGLAAHLDQSETTLAQCWRVIRSDGVVLGFTDHDRALVVSGTSCDPMSGLDSGEVPSRLGAQVETGEVIGLLHAAAISESDITLGRYDGAQVETWLVNWASPSQATRLRVDTIGEIVREDGIFRAELRSAQEALNVTRGRLYQGLCDAQFGDSRCGKNAALPAYRTIAVVTTVIDPFRLQVDGTATFEPGWFAFGAGRWTSGPRHGLEDAVIGHQRETGGDVLVFSEPVGGQVEVGDALTVTAGCDRRFSTCRERFANATNFRGFPHIPGSDYVLRHPRQGDALDGRAVVP